MDFPDVTLCDKCGCEARVVVVHGLDGYGNKVLRPALVANEQGLFVFVDCLLHGRIAQCIASPSDAHLGKYLVRPLTAPKESAQKPTDDRRRVAVERPAWPRPVQLPRQNRRPPSGIPADLQHA